MRTYLQQIRDEAEALRVQHTATVVQHIIKELKEVNKVQPKITRVSFSQGAWWFNGPAFGVYLNNADKEDAGKAITINDFGGYLKDLRAASEYVRWIFKCAINNSCHHVWNLCNYLVASESFTNHTYVESVCDKGVIFRTTMVPENVKSLPLYKELVKSKIPVIFDTTGL